MWGRPLALGYSVAYDASGNPVGMEFWSSYPGWDWQVTMTCTDQWPQPPA